jgi:MoaA/NifB/PqqE/SkfB family radical SAM enzyme
MMEKNSNQTTNPFYHYEEIWKSENFKEWEKEQTEEYKEYRRKWTDCPKNQTPADFPLSINLEIITTCNAGTNYCVMCPKHFLEVKGEIMSKETAFKILEEARENGTYAVNLNGAGESTLHPDLVEIIQKAHDLGYLDIMFHTNGTLLTEELSKKLINAGLTKLIVSVDAPDKETYSQIRPAFDFDTVVKNIKNFVKIRNDLGKKEPIVRMTMVVMTYNKDKIKETIDLWKQYVDFISINDCMYFDKYKAFAFDKEKINNDAKKEDMSYVCAPLYQQLSVCVNNKVIACSTIYAKNYRILGDYSKQSLKEIWEGPDLKEIREMHEAGKCSKVMPCIKCDLPQIELLKRMKSAEQKVLRD